MAFDTNPFPTGYGNQQPQSGGISMPQQPQGTGVVGGLNGMVQALMGGYNKYLDRQKNQMPGQSQNSGVNNAPMNITPNASQTPGLPMSIDPMMQGLFGQLPENNPTQYGSLY